MKKILNFSTDFLKSPRPKFRENPSSGSRADIYGRTDMTKLIGAFHDFTKAPKNLSLPQPCFVFTSDMNERVSICL